jgi:N-acetylglucosamine-6-phosphate deacetylase
MNILLRNGKIINSKIERGNSSLLLEGEFIKEILAHEDSLVTVCDEVLELNRKTIIAGFIDIHNHGAVGVDVNSTNAEDLHKVSRFLATKGVTAWLPTLVPDSDENYRKVIQAIDELMETQDEREPAARVLGVHYEGVFANEKMCGALRPQFFKTFKNGNEIETLPKIKNRNAIHFTTLAPEVENGIELVKELIKQNWIVSIGHTKADSETLEKAKQAGAKHLTHFFNAMTGLHHRDLGVVGWGLTDEEVTFDIIADGVHVAPKMLQFACQNKTSEKTILISDSVAPTGLGDGEFEIWDEKISVVNGKTQNERGSIAGSVITMLDAVKQMLSLEFSKMEVSKMASANPARLLGVEKTHGSIEVGKRADLVALDEKGNVKLCLVGGRIALDKL